MWKFVCVVLIVLIPVLGRADTASLENKEQLPISAQQLLNKMKTAMHVLNYYGTVVLFKNGHLERLQFSHSNNNGLEMEQLQTLKAPMQKMIREASQVSTFFKSGRVVVNHQPIKQSFLLELPENLADVSLCYFVEYAGEDKILGLDTRIIILRSKDKFRYSRKIWVDKQSFLPLKFELLSHSGISLEQIVFTQLEVKDDLTIHSPLATPEKNIRHIQQLNELPIEQASFVVQKFPEGFRPVLFTRRAMAHSKNLTEHLLVNDGFSTVSIYFELKNSKIKLGQRSRGSLNAISRSLENYHLTVMGEVPIETVQMIADNIALKPR